MDALWQYEREALAAGHTAVCGCDEAGAGPLALPGVRGGGDPRPGD